MRVLIVEDDPSLAVILRGALMRELFVVDWVQDGRVAGTCARDEEYDLILLDLGLPGCDGFEVSRMLRSAQVDTPILVITGRDTLDDRVNGLDSGADDYVIKPVEIPELLARVRALIRRGRSKQLTCALTYGPLSLDQRSHVATLEGVRLDLTATEYRLLECLLQRAETPVSRSQLIQHVWGGGLPRRSNNPEVYISYLREKLSRSRRDLIRTIRGIGYMLVDPGVPEGESDRP